MIARVSRCLHPWEAFMVDDGGRATPVWQGLEAKA